MPPYINIVRSDGSVISATPEEAKNLALLGYREESASEAASREAQKAVEAHYTTLGQKADAALEAGLRGATLGLTDYIAGDEDSANRRRYNPGLSTAFEIGGALVPLVLSGGESAAAESSVLARVAGLAPTTIVSRGARAVAGVTEETGALRSVMAGALEGGAYGGAQEVNRAYLDGDPVTAESVLHGIGWGAVYGGALTGVGEGLMGAGRKLAARGEEVTAGRLGQEAENAWRSEAAAADHKVDLFRTGLDQDAVRTANKYGQEAANTRLAKWNSEIDAITEENAAKAASHERATKLIDELNVKRAAAQEEAEWANKYSIAKADPIAPTRDAYTAFHAEVQNSAKALDGVQKAADRAMKGIFEEFNRIPPEELVVGTTRRDIGMIKRSYNHVQKAIESGNPRQIENAIGLFSEKLDAFNEYFGAHYKPAQALEELARTRAVTKVLAEMPKSADEFVAMSPKQADRIFAALDGAKQLRAYPEIAKAVEGAASGFGSSAGLATNGTADLRKTWEALRNVKKAEAMTFGKLEPIAKGPAPKMEPLPKEPSRFKPKAEPKAPQDYREPRPKTVKEEAAPQGGAPIGDAGFWAVKALTGSTHKAAAWAAAKTVMAKLRGQTLDRIEQAAAKYLPKAGKAIKFAAPRIDPLKVKLDGNYEAANKPREELAADRVREFMAAYPTINDRMFKAVEPLMQHEPALAPAMHKAGVDAFNALMGELPKDPGSVSGLRPIWKPSPIEAETLARKLAVFHDPVGEAEQMMSSGDFDPIKVKTMKVVAPNVWNNLRISMLTRMEDPAFVDRMSYQDQIGLGTMLDLNLHSSMRPEQIATHQQLFLQRNQPLPTPQPAGSSSSSGGRPAATSPGATQGQKVTDR